MTVEDEVEDAISSLVVKYWEEQQSPYLLSEIGTFTRREFPNFHLPSGFGMKEFCKNISTLQMVVHPRVPQKIGLIPATQAVPEDIATLFDATKPSTRSPVFVDSFWRAFIDPLKVKRFVCLDVDGGFQVVESESKPQSGVCHEIMAADISASATDAPISEKARLTAERIETWIGRNGLDSSVFERSRSSFLRERRSGGALIAFIDAVGVLSIDDQKRMSIPLDILVKLSEAR